MVRPLNRFPDRPADGFSLVELLVTIAILAVVLSGLTAGAISIYRASSFVDLSTTDQNEARTAISVLSRDIRAAAPVRPSTDPAFLVAQPNEAIFTANLNDSIRPRLVRFWIDEDRRLIEDATPPDPGTDPETGLDWDVENDAVVRYIAAFVVNDATLPLFRYFDQNGVELTYSESDACSGPDGGTVPPPCLTAENRQRIALVELTLVVSSDPGDRVGEFTVTHRVRLPNA
ncbi:MAG: type II secretion system protein J [Nitriliruptoraceae bacterium]